MNGDTSMAKRSGPRNLMRMGSANHWDEEAVAQQTEEMEQVLRMMQEQNTQSKALLCGSYQ